MTDTEPPAESGATTWRELAAAEKRARVLRVAGQLFALEGVEFPMPKLAKELGIGVGSIYRQVGTKDDVLAALVIDRLELFEQRFREVAGSDDPVKALDDAVAYTVEQTLQDRVAKISFELGLDRDDVAVSRESAADALKDLVEAAKAAGGLRADADVIDLRVMFRTAREAEKIRAGAGRRLAALVMAGLRPGAMLGPPYDA